MIPYKTSELGTKPNRTFNIYPNVNEKQRILFKSHKKQGKHINDLILM